VSTGQLILAATKKHGELGRGEQIRLLNRSIF